MKWLGNLCLTVGIVMILSAGALAAHNRLEASQAGKRSEDVVQKIELQLEQRQEVMVTEPEMPLLPVLPQTTEPEHAEMPELEVDGLQYVGYLSIPAMERQLPVLSDWDEELLKTAPCRYSGSTVTDDLVIMAHNYREHFGRLSRLTIGDTLTLTDMDGVVHGYEVVAVEVLESHAIDDMTAGAYDLTLFTCTFGGESRVTVRCDRME